jgi:hypothetical protein
MSLFYGLVGLFNCDLNDSYITKSEPSTKSLCYSVISVSNLTFYISSENRSGNKEVMPMQDSSKRMGLMVEVNWLCAGAVL